MKFSWGSVALLLAGLTLSGTTFINSHADIKTFSDLMQLQNFSYFLGSLAGCVIAWFGKSPINGGVTALLSRLTGSGNVPVPPVPPSSPAAKL